MRNLITHIAEWNRKYPVGTEIILMFPSGAKMRRRTHRPALLANGREAIIWVEGQSEPYPLDWIRPVRESW